jgi:chlorosome envelope protein B
MSNGSNVDISGTISNLADTLGGLVKLQVDTLNNGLKTVSELVDPLTKTATDLATNLVGTLNNILQSVSAAIGPKK